MLRQRQTLREVVNAMSWDGKETGRVLSGPHAARLDRSRFGGYVSRLTSGALAGSQTAPASPGPAILVVDDDEEVRVIVAEFLEDFGYSVIQAEGGSTALRLLDHNPSVKLVITDIRMPDMSGFELADIATARQADLRIILISGYFVAKQVTRRFLRKPFRMRELQAAVKAELELAG
jgi:CheY-like chemotaxis protein